jgi:TolB protein
MPRRHSWLFATVLTVSTIASLDAQRAPVLRQVAAPHAYYWREMYVPQVTSGPSGAAWSPEGRELIYSMQGTLWRQALDSREARQLTDGPGYDYEPDWSPDGKFVAYASYRDDAIELRVLELATGLDRPLVRDGAVNLEPRWSPDGSRIAYVSTATGGRWHLATIRMHGGEPGEIAPLTVDHAGGLPRYYYAAIDHELSPSWSPDGTELLFVSNRGHIYGSGGIWRMAVAPGGAMQEIHYEETTWRARPDWSRDGRRVVYSSYQGRQWNQLWLMTSEGGDPLQLTYGEFDATSPRWSPDGRRIAFISNDGGNTSLRVIEIPGGRQSRVDATRRVYRRPMARLRLTIVDAATGAPVPARVSVTGPDGRGWAPDSAWRHADDGFDRTARRFEPTYFHAAGRAELMVPAGESMVVDVTRGLEYVVARQAVVATAAGTAVTISIHRLANLPASGWYSGDLHVHMNYGGVYRNTPAHLEFQAESEDLHVIENLIVNKEQRIPDISYFRSTPDPASTARTIIAHGQEFHTSYWGHTALLGLSDHLLVPDYAAYVNTAAASLYPTNANVMDFGHAQGALGGYVHPYEGEPPDPSSLRQDLTHEFPADVALGKVDYVEVGGFSDHLITAGVWYRLLNCGFRIPAGAGTDAMANFASLHGPVGMNRVFVHLAPGERFDHRAFLDGLRAGRTFATNGPLLWFTLGGHEIGDEIRVPVAPARLAVHARLESIVPIDHFQLVANGHVVASFALPGNRTAYALDTTIVVEKSGWYTLRAFSDHAQYPVLDIYPFGTTSPIYVTVAGAPVRSRADANYFVAWMDRLISGAGAHAGWNTPSERDEVLGLLNKARAEFVTRALPP